MRSARGRRVAERPRADVRQRVGSCWPATCASTRPTRPVRPWRGPHTRVVEYALDTQEHEGHVAWSHAPQIGGAEQPWYAWFMGSARRRANGNTLIGWSAETRALATEVAPDGDVLWRLRLARAQTGAAAGSPTAPA